MTNQKIKCSKPNCQEEGLYRVGDLKHARVLCAKHYAEYLRRRAATNGSIVWGGLE